MRKLYVIQMVHSLGDMRRYPNNIRDTVVSRAEKILSNGLTVNGKLLPGNKCNPWYVIDCFWTQVDALLQQLGFLSPSIASELYVYCESLFHDSRRTSPLKQIKFSVEDGNPLFILVSKLQQLGAQIKGTESKQLLNSALQEAQALVLE